MPATAYRFEIDPSVALAEAEMSLHLAMIALEGLFGGAAVRLDARYRLDEAARAVVVDGSTPVGGSLVRVFATLLAREFGDDGFSVRRVGEDALPPATGTGAPGGPAECAAPGIPVVA